VAGQRADVRVSQRPKVEVNDRTRRNLKHASLSVIRPDRK